MYVNIFFFAQRGDLVVVKVEALYTSQPCKSGGREGFDLIVRKGEVRHALEPGEGVRRHGANLVVVKVEALYTSSPGKSGGREGFDLAARKGQVRHSKTGRLCSLEGDVQRDVKRDP